MDRTPESGRGPLCFVSSLRTFQGVAVSLCPLRSRSSGIAELHDFFIELTLWDSSGLPCGKARIAWHGARIAWHGAWIAFASPTLPARTHKPLCARMPARLHLLLCSSGGWPPSGWRPALPETETVPSRRSAAVPPSRRPVGARPGHAPRDAAAGPAAERDLLQRGDQRLREGPARHDTR